MLSDCEKCWDTPCTCGWDYRNANLEYLVAMRDMFQELIDGKHRYSIKQTKGMQSDVAFEDQAPEDGR